MTKKIRPIYRKMIAQQPPRRGLEAFGAESTGGEAAPADSAEEPKPAKTRKPKTKPSNPS